MSPTRTKPRRKKCRGGLVRESTALAGHLAALLSLAGVRPTAAVARSLLASVPARADEAVDPPKESLCCYLLATAQSRPLSDEQAARYQRSEDFFLERWPRRSPRRRARVAGLVLGVLTAFESRGVTPESGG